MPDGWALPVITEFNRGFFGTGKLVIQECVSCGGLQHPPEELCHQCRATKFRGREVTAQGTVYSFIVVHHPPAPALAGRVPYTVALVSLNEHPEIRIVGNVVDLSPHEVHIGLPVSVTFDEVDDPDGGTIFLPQWKAGDMPAPLT
jgi:uncharacterized OB-fold protein